MCCQCFIGMVEMSFPLLLGGSVGRNLRHQYSHIATDFGSSLSLMSHHLLLDLEFGMRMPEKVCTTKL